MKRGGGVANGLFIRVFGDVRALRLVQIRIELGEVRAQFFVCLNGDRYRDAQKASSADDGVVRCGVFNDMRICRACLVESRDGGIPPLNGRSGNGFSEFAHNDDGNERGAGHDMLLRGFFRVGMNGLYMP